MIAFLSVVGNVEYFMDCCLVGCVSVCRMLICVIWCSIL
jgi:hypothetical protein